MLDVGWAQSREQWAVSSTQIWSDWEALGGLSHCLHCVARQHHSPPPPLQPPPPQPQLSWNVEMKQKWYLDIPWCFKSEINDICGILLRFYVFIDQIWTSHETSNELEEECMLYYSYFFDVIGPRSSWLRVIGQIVILQRNILTIEVARGVVQSILQTLSSPVQNIDENLQIIKLPANCCTFIPSSQDEISSPADWVVRLAVATQIAEN